MIKINRKKAQQEMVGFVLIVIIVVIIGLFLVVLYLRQPQADYNSLNVENFLQASMPYTTSCDSGTDHLALSELIKACYRNDQCSNEKRACEVLNDTLFQLLQESWPVGPNLPQNAYSLNIYYEETIDNSTSDSKTEVLSLNKGNCTGNKMGAENFLHYGTGNIVTNLEICSV